MPITINNHNKHKHKHPSKCGHQPKCDCEPNTNTSANAGTPTKPTSMKQATTRALAMPANNQMGQQYTQWLTNSVEIVVIITTP